MNFLSAVSPVLLVIAGLVVCFFGYRLLRLTLGLAGFATGLALGLTVAGLIHGAGQVFTIILAVVGGVIGAALAVLLYKVGVFLLGAGAAALVAGVVATATAWQYPMIARVVAALAGGILTLFIERPLISILSALGGSWATVFGAFQLFGWYRLTPGAKSPPPQYGWMIACWLVLGLVGAGVQLRSGRKAKAKE